MNRRINRLSCVWLSTWSLVACAGSGSSSGTAAAGGSVGAGGAPGGGGTSATVTGGMSALGGSPSEGGTSSSSGGRAQGGAATGVGGDMNGGAPSIGGNPSFGGLGGTSAGTGGVRTGGVTSGGNAPSTGGTFANAGASNVASGGTRPIGGATSTGGTKLSGGAPATGGATSTGGAVGTCPVNFTNPLIFQDLPDNDVVRVDNTFYYSASSFHFSPGAPILRSYDLVNWEFIGHSVPTLDFNNSYSLIGGRSYNNGIWASSLRYRKSNKTWYWIGCMHGNGGGYMYTAPAIEGPWTKHSTSYCYYDVGLLIDDDDTMYAAYGNTTISVAQLSADGFSQAKTQNVYTSGSEGALEGSRFYKINGTYYIMPTQYANGEYILRSSGGPFGPYTLNKFAVKLKSPITPEPTVGGAPHQGSIVDTPNGDWYYMAFIDAYPGGRIPVLAPITWTDGIPSVNLVNGGWGVNYPYPKGLPCSPTKPLTGTDAFAGPGLGHEWEWNHNPDNTKWSAASGLTLQTATVTSDLYAARNTLTHRVLGPKSTATIELDYSAMKDGDVAGLSLFRQTSAWIGVKMAGGAAKVSMTNGLTMTSTFATASTGTEAASQSITGGKIWLRIAADITPGQNRQAKFYYSTDGSAFAQLGPAFTLDHTWAFFMGYRYAIFNYATTALGGSIKVSSFSLTQP